MKAAKKAVKRVRLFKPKAARSLTLSAIVACALQGVSMATAFAQALPDEEYGRNYGLRAIGVLWPWGAGATGAGATVALVDSGVASGHPDLAGRVLPGFDFVDGDTSAEDQSATSHGTTIAGIIAGRRDGNGIVGVAHNAFLIPVRVTDANHQGTEENLARGILWAANTRANVVNVGIAKGPFERAEVLSSLRVAADRGKVIVMPAGNESSGGVFYPAAYAGQLGGRALIVGATGPGGGIAAFSNRPGGLAEHYVVAPGEGVISTTRGGGYNTPVGGTSWATGFVSGAAALLAGAFPELDAETIVRILKETATDLGAPGVDGVYGWGQINVRAAMAPQGELTIPDGGGGGSSGSGIGAVALVGAVAVGSAIAWSRSKRKKTLKKAMIIDKYGRGYTADVTGLINPTDSANSLRQVLNSLRQTTQRVGLKQDDISMVTFDFSQDDVGVDESDQRFDLESQTPTQWNIDMRSKLSRSFSLGYTKQGGSDFAHNDDDLHYYSLLAPQALSGDDYLKFGNIAQTWSLNWSASQALDVRFGYVDSDDDTRFGNDSDATVVSFDFQPHDRFDLGLQLSQTVEDGSLLGGSSNGPLSVARATTAAVGLTAGLRLTERVSVFGAWQTGRTRAVDDPNAILSDVSRIRSHTYGIGIAANSLLADNDQFGITVSRPLRVTSGAGILNIPIGYDAFGGIKRKSENWNLVPDAKETDLEVFYRRPIGPDGAFGTHLLYRNNAYNSKDYGDDVSVLATFRLNFK